MDLNILMEALVYEMKWKMMRELEHIHKHLDQVENEYENQPYSILQACRKERVPVK